MSCRNVDYYKLQRKFQVKTIPRNCVQKHVLQTKDTKLLRFKELQSTGAPFNIKQFCPWIVNGSRQDKLSTYTYICEIKKARLVHVCRADKIKLFLVFLTYLLITSSKLVY